MASLIEPSNTPKLFVGNAAESPIYAFFSLFVAFLGNHAVSFRPALCRRLRVRPCTQAVPPLWGRGSRTAPGANGSETRGGSSQGATWTSPAWLCVGVPTPVRHLSPTSLPSPAFNSPPHPPPSSFRGTAVLKGKPLRCDALGVKLAAFQHGEIADAHFNTLLLGRAQGRRGGAAPRGSETPTPPQGAAAAPPKRP